MQKRINKHPIINQMKFLITSAILLLVLLTACQNEKTGNDKTLAESQTYVINSLRDTILKTKNGALLDIRAGTIIAEKDSRVTLEVKEAYTIEQMIHAKLLTRSNGEILSSGGMIYVNAAAGQQVRFVGQIGVSIPTDFIQNKMNVYRGETSADGKINWVEPDTLPINETEMLLASSKALFDSKCGSCHGIGVQKTAPDLAYFPQRFEYEEGFSQYYNHNISRDRNNYDTVRSEITSADTSALRMDQEVSGVINYDRFWYYKCNLMAAYPTKSNAAIPDIDKLITNEQQHQIYAYIENESRRLAPPAPAQAYLYSCVDSCMKYTEAKNTLTEKRKELSAKRSNLSGKNGSMVERKAIDTTTSRTNTIPTVTPPPQDRLTSQDINAEYYQFTIETFGWFNIDVLLKNIDGVKESELFVRITGEYRTRTQVFLIIPSHKVYVDAKPTGRTEDEFAFVTADGKLLLPHNVKAYLLALYEEAGKIGYQLQEFTISAKQEFQMSVQMTTVEKFQDAIRMLNFSGFDLSVKKTINADSIAVIDATLQNIDEKLNEAELLKPTGCDCTCGEEGSSPTTFILRGGAEGENIPVAND